MNIKGMLVSLFDKFKASLSGSIDYPVNDPGAPLIVHEQIPDLPSPCPLFAVQGFSGEAKEPHSLQWQAAGVYTMLVDSIRFLQSHVETPLTNWARTKQLIIMTRAGQMFNAYYDGSSLRFFYGKHPTDGHMIFSCESSDVVSHELGHAILDAYRPDLWSAASLEIHAFHESFGDINAILSALSHNEVIDYVLKETNGNLRQSNMVSRLAEEMGGAIFAQMGRTAESLRNAVNDFKYVAPETLTNSAPSDQLSREPHNFSRVFTGLFYDVLVNQFEANSKDHPPKDALIMARDQVASVIYNGASHAANVIGFYESVARAMLVVDDQRGGQCKDALTKAFSKRNIIRPSLPATQIAYKLDNKEVKILRHRNGTAVRVGGIKDVKLIDEMVVTQSENPLYSVEVEVPNEHYIEYDNKGRLKLDQPVVKETVLRSVKNYLDFLHQTDKVSYDNSSNKEFAVVNNKLVHNFICCNRLD